MISKRFLLMALVLTVLIFPVADPAYSGGRYSKINGKYKIGGPFAFGDVEPGKSHIHIKLKGKTARGVYHAMDAEEKDNECEKGKVKSVGDMVCMQFSKKDYECTFAIKINSQKIVGTGSC